MRNVCSLQRIHKLPKVHESRRVWLVDGEGTAEPPRSQDGRQLAPVLERMIVHLPACWHEWQVIQYDILTWLLQILYQVSLQAIQGLVNARFHAHLNHLVTVRFCGVTNSVNNSGLVICCNEFEGDMRHGHSL